VVFRSNRHEGFTILELLVASTVSAMLMWAIYTIFNGSNRIANMLDDELEIRQNARAVFARMELDLSSAFLDPNGEYFDGDGGTVRCMTAVATEVQTDGDSTVRPITEVRYSCSGTELRRAIDTDGQAPFTSSGLTADDVLAENVDWFRLRYWYTSQGQSSWHTSPPGRGRLPSAVEVTLQLKIRQTVRTFFDIIPVAQGR